MNHLNPQRIIETGMGFWPAKVLLSAVELGLFTELGDKALTGEALRRKLGLHERANPDFFDALVALKFLERDGDGPDARYHNTAETAVFLNENSPAYMGGLFDMANARLYPFWGALSEALKTGEPQNEIKQTGEPLFKAIYADPARLEQFIGSMTAITMGNALALAETFDFSKYKSLCDVGGAGAALCLAVAARHPHLQCVSADLPAVTAIAQKRIAAANMSERVIAVDLDFFAEPLPSADIITMGNILHDWNLDTKKMLIGKTYDALPKGGAFIVVENIIDDARRENAFGLMMSLNMLIETGDGFDFTGADFDRWCKEAGFARTEVIPLAGPTSAAVAYK